MKKLLSLIVVSLFVMFFSSGLVFAASNYTYENVTILGSEMGGAGQTPPVEAIRVTVGSDDDSIAVGDVMAWSIQPQVTDTNALGFFVEKMRRALSEDTNVNEAGHGPYAGVMITTATSNDLGSGIGWTNANPTRPQSSMGFMAIRGYCDAQIDVSRATQGRRLFPVDIPEGTFMTANNSTDKNHLSEDIGFLLEVVASADGLHKVWLR